MLAVTCHVTAQTLCEGLRQVALEKYDRLALLVLNSWGIHATRDFGEIIYALIAAVLAR